MKTFCQSILVAEDNDDIREAIEEALQNEGYEVHTAKDGKVALEKLKTLSSPTLVLLDLMMPVMSGWEFLAAKEADAVLAPHRVVTISAVSATQSLEDATPLATQGALSKPLELDPLLNKVKEFCLKKGA